MPYSSIEKAKEGDFPTTLDDIDLTLAQVNHLADIYDSIKAEGGVSEPMAVAITTFKKAYKKEEDGWVRTESAMSEGKMTEVIKAVKKEFKDKLYKLDQKEIFKTGTWIDSMGDEYTFTDEDLDEIIEAFNKGVRSRDGVPLRFDSHGNKYDPAVGWVERVWKKGKSLFASFRGIPKAVKDLIENGQYKRVSAGLIGDYKDPVINQTFGNVLDHVALLGAKAPGVKGLADWGKIYDENGKVFMFSEGEDGLEQEYKCECIECGYKMTSEKHCEELECPECGGDMRREERPGTGSSEDKHLPSEDEDNIEEKEENVMSEKLKQLNEKLSSEVADLKEEKDSIAKSYSDIKEEKADLEKKVEEYEETIKENKKSAKEESVKSFLESDEVSKRITPAQMGMYEEVLMSTEDVEEKKEEILSYPEIIDFKEKSTASTEEEQVDNDRVKLEDSMGQSEGKKVEFDGYELSKEAKELVEKGEFETFEEAIISLS